VGKILGMDRSVCIHSKTKPNHPKCYTYIAMLLKTAATHAVSDHQQDHIQKETSRVREREREKQQERPLRDQKTTQCKLKVCTFESITPVTTLALDTDVPIYQTIMQALRQKHFHEQSPCAHQPSLSRGKLITEQHHPQSKRENGKLDCYLSIKSSS
jgi:hypothetical protein